MILVVNLLIILLPLLLLTALAWFTLLSGFRRSDQPACRGCRASLVRSGALLTQCPECDAPLGPKSVVFLGRTRPWPIWVITFLLTAPSALVLGTVIVLATGVIDPAYLVRTLNGEDTGGLITIREAEGYETDELIAQMVARKTDASTWAVLWNRFVDAPPMNEDQALDILSAAREELSRSGNNFILERSWMITKVVNQLGHGHPSIQDFFQDHLLEPAGCPSVKLRKNTALTIDYAGSPATAKADILKRMRNEVRPYSVATAIRIDGIDIKPRNERGRTIWRPGWGGRHQKMLYTRYLPPSVLEPGEHTLEIDLTNVVLPNGIPSNLPPEEWPAVVVRKDATLTCSFTIDDPNSPKPK